MGAIVGAFSIKEGAALGDKMAGGGVIELPWEEMKLLTWPKTMGGTGWSLPVVVVALTLRFRLATTVISTV